MGICLCKNSFNDVRINDLILQVTPKNISEILIPIENNSAMSTSQKEIEENIIIINKSNEMKDNSKENKIDFSLERDNKSACFEEKKDKEKVNKTFLKSNSLVLKPSANIFNIKDNFNIIHEQPLNNFQFSKSKSLREQNLINSNNYFFHFNNLQGHLETVIETISEVSNSKKESRVFSKKNNSILKLINNDNDENFI